MLRKVRPNVRDRLDLLLKFGSALAMPSSVIKRQRLPRSAAEMQRRCSAGVLAVFVTTRGNVAAVKIAGAFDSRRLHLEASLRIIATWLFLLSSRRRPSRRRGAGKFSASASTPIAAVESVVRFQDWDLVLYHQPDYLERYNLHQHPNRFPQD